MRTVAGIVLDPRTGKRALPSPKILVPPAHADKRGPLVGKCCVPQRDSGKIGCGRVFHKGEEEKWQRHVGECARANMEQIMAIVPSEANRGKLFDPASRDPDLVRHFRGVKERMIEEGRWTLHENERAEVG